MDPTDPHRTDLPTRALLALAAGLILAWHPGSAGADRHGDAPPELDAAAWIERSSQALLPEESMRARARLVTGDGFGGESETVLDLLRARVDGAWRTLIEVEAPEEGEGLAYEIVARPGQPLERWVWLPYENRLRKVSGISRTDPFMGSEFTYEDLGLTVPTERGEGEVRLIEVGAGHIVEVESEPYHVYDRVVTRIDPQTGLPTVVRFYDRAGQLYRDQSFRNIRVVDGHPFPMEITIRGLLTGSESTLHFDRVEFGAEIPERIFSESMVRRRLRAAEELVGEPGSEARPPD